MEKKMMYWLCCNSWNLCTWCTILYYKQSMALKIMMDMKSARIPRNFLLNGSLVAMHFNEGIGMCWSHDALGIDCVVWMRPKLWEDVIQESGQSPKTNPGPWQMGPLSTLPKVPLGQKSFYLSWCCVSLRARTSLYKKVEKYYILCIEWRHGHNQTRIEMKNVLPFLRLVTYAHIHMRFEKEKICIPHQSLTNFSNYKN